MGGEAVRRCCKPHSHERRNRRSASPLPVRPPGVTAPTIGVCSVHPRTRNFSSGAAWSLGYGAGSLGRMGTRARALAARRS